MVPFINYLRAFESGCRKLYVSSVGGILKLNLSYCAFAALTAFTWMLMAFYPPWIVVEDPSIGVKTYNTKFYGYASIWEPPNTESLNGAMVEVDVGRLLLQDLGVLVPIAFLWFFSASFRREMERAEAQENEYHGPQANQSLSRPLRIVLCAISLGCIGTSVFLLKDNVHLARLTPMVDQSKSPK